MNLLLNLVVRGISHIWVGNLSKYIIIIIIGFIF